LTSLVGLPASRAQSTAFRAPPEEQILEGLFRQDNRTCSRRIGREASPPPLTPAAEEPTTLPPKPSPSYPTPAGHPMAVQILPIIKAVAPYVAQIATAAIPAFTAKPAETAKNDPITARQIEELQAAATQNAQSIHLMAEKLKQAIEGIEAAAQDAQRQLATYKTLLFMAFGLSGLSMLISIIALLK
jgi:hypothetical protein